MLLGPLAGGAVGALTAAFGLTPTGNQAKDTTAITNVIQSGNMTPEIIAAIRIADQKHAEIISQQGIDLVKINADHQQAQDALVIDDVKDARLHNSDNKHVMAIACLILVTFAAIMGAVLYGCYFLLNSTVPVLNKDLAIAIAGIVGSVVGYVAVNAQTVINFLYGGSLGSRNNSKTLADTVQSSIQQLATSTPASASADTK
jgi:gas vesicle protein